MRKILAALFIVALSGCASMNTPSSSLIDTVPVVKVGESANVPKEHIVFIPANKEFPIVGQWDRGQVTITTKVFLRYATLNKGNISWQENHAQKQIVKAYEKGYPQHGLAKI